MQIYDGKIVQKVAPDGTIVPIKIGNENWLLPGLDHLYLQNPGYKYPYAWLKDIPWVTAVKWPDGTVDIYSDISLTDPQWNQYVLTPSKFYTRHQVKYTPFQQNIPIIETRTFLSNGAMKEWSWLLFEKFDLGLPAGYANPSQMWKQYRDKLNTIDDEKDGLTHCRFSSDYYNPPNIWFLPGDSGSITTLCDFTNFGKFMSQAGYNSADFETTIEEQKELVNGIITPEEYAELTEEIEAAAEAAEAAAEQAAADAAAAQEAAADAEQAAADAAQEAAAAAADAEQAALDAQAAAVAAAADAEDLAAQEAAAAAEQAALDAQAAADAAQEAAQEAAAAAVAATEEIEPQIAAAAEQAETAATTEVIVEAMPTTITTGTTYPPPPPDSTFDDEGVGDAPLSPATLAAGLEGDGTTVTSENSAGNWISEAGYLPEENTSSEGAADLVSDILPLPPGQVPEIKDGEPSGAVIMHWYFPIGDPNWGNHFKNDRAAKIDYSKAVKIGDPNFGQKYEGYPFKLWWLE